MRFFSGAFLIGAALSLEGMRRTFLGGSFLTLFIIKEFGLPNWALYTIDLLEKYLDIEAEMISRIKTPLAFFIRPWSDHNAAGRTYLDVLKIMAEDEFPATCQFYWPE